MGELIQKHRGNLSAVARALKMPRNTIYAWIADDPELQRIRDDEREAVLDNAEDKLGKAVDKGEAWAVCFTLKTQGKERGYTEKQEIEQKTELNLDKGVVDLIEKIYGR